MLVSPVNVKDGVDAEPAPTSRVVKAIELPATTAVPLAAGNVSVKLLFEFGDAIVNVPVPLESPDRAIFDNLILLYKCAAFSAKDIAFWLLSLKTENNVGPVVVPFFTFGV